MAEEVFQSQEELESLPQTNLDAGKAAVEEESDSERQIREHYESEYKYGFVTNIEQDIAPKGLTEDTIRLISSKKDEPEWMLEWRLKAFETWKKMKEPKWPNVHYPEIDFQDISYWAAPKEKPKLNSLDEADPELLKT